MLFLLVVCVCVIVALFLSVCDCFNMASKYVRILCGARFCSGSINNSIASRKAEYFYCGSHPPVRLFRKFRGELRRFAETMIFISQMTGKYRGDLRRPRIQTSAQRNISILAREFPSADVAVAVDVYMFMFTG